jgi:hypothetical protein
MSPTSKKSGSRRRKKTHQGYRTSGENGVVSDPSEGSRAPQFIVGEGELNSSEDAQDIYISSIKTKENE